MSDDKILEEVKKRLAITDTYHDALLFAYLQDTKDYLESVGVSDEILSDKKSLGLLTRGVIDLWNNQPSSGKFSEIFYQRAIQLRAETIENKED